jgi:hypothetical protein
MSIIIEYPILAAAIGAALVALGWRGRSRVAVGAGALWLLYALYELGMKRRWLCSGECNIRVESSADLSGAAAGPGGGGYQPAPRPSEDAVGVEPVKSYLEP